MCRLLGLVSHTAATFSGALGADQLDRFRDMSRLHCDGWGAAWHAEGGLAAYHNTDAALADPGFPRIAAATVTDAAIAHLRWASEHMATRDANTHPFLADGFAFAHNGYIGPSAELDLLVPESAAAGVLGTTDSERYFGLIRGHLHDGLDPFDATLRAVAELRSRYPRASLNALLLGPDELIAVHASTAARPDIAGMLAAGFTPETLPAGHLDGYYRMRIRHGADGSVAVASSGLETTGWEPLPEESVTRIDRLGATVTTRAVVPDFVE